MVATATKKTRKRTRPAKATAANPKTNGTATANDATKPATKGKAKAKPEPSKRAKAFDTSPCAVIRWCRAQGWDFAKTKAALAGVGVVVSDTTIRCQLAPRRGGRPAELTKDQIKPLTDAAK